MDWTEIVGFVLGAWCVYLTVRQNVWNFPVGIVQCSFFIVLFVKAGLYADASLQVMFIALGVMGWFWWLHGGPQRTELPVSTMPRAAIPVVVAAGVVSLVVLELVLDHLTDSTVPFWDALVTVLSLVAQYLLNRKWIENWYVWIVTDVISIALYVYKGLDLTAILYVGFIGLCVFGLLGWRRTLRAVRVPEPELVRQ